MNKKDKYLADENRYQKMNYRRTGNSGLLLPELSLGLWHNFGKNDNFNNSRELLKCAFDNGITHFDLANNYGPPPGSAEKNFGKILKKDFKSYRDDAFRRNYGHFRFDGSPRKSIVYWYF